MTHSYCFDVDGTLVNTRDLNRQAYRAVGVDIPDEAWGLRWQDWLPALVGDLGEATQLHRRKGEVYGAMLNDADVDKMLLPAAWVARRLLRDASANVWCATAGTFRTARFLLFRLELPVPLVSNLTYEMRRDLLRDAATSFRPLTYVDDVEDTVRRLRSDVPEVRCVHYFPKMLLDELERLVVVTANTREPAGRS